MQSQIKIGPSFFAKTKNDYSDWRWGWVRELAQNSLDSVGCSLVQFEFSLNEDGNTIAVCENDGNPMTKDILCEKFLAIGESGKNFNNSVGGFGAAKLLIAFCHLSYTIRTGTMLVEGCGGNYNLTEDLEYFHGTRTTVLMKGNETEYLENNVEKFIALAQWHGTVYLNSNEHTCEMKKGTPRREFDFGKIYTNKSCENLFVVRINGIPMFTQRVDLNRCVILELSGSSLNTLTSNRDGLTGSIRWQVEQFISELAVDKRKALKKPIQPKYQRFIGDKFNAVTRESSGINIDTEGLVAAFKQLSVVAGGSGGGLINDDRTYSGLANVDELKSQLAEMFIIKNETDLKIPDYYIPNKPDFGTYAKKLAIIWGKLMLTMHTLFNNSDQFSIGFIFADAEDGDDEKDMTLAEYEETDKYGKVYYLNPVCVVKQTGSESRSFKKRFLLTERNRLITYALHEFVHGSGFLSHNDDYAYKFTELIVEVLNNRQKFNWCFL